MSNKVKVRLSEIVNSAGLSGVKALKLMNIPMCDSIQLQSQLAEEETKVTIYYGDESKKTYTSKSGKVISIEAAFPVISYIETSGENIIIFSYQEVPDIRKLFFIDRISIPMPPEWPRPNFLTSKYPPPE